MHKEKTMTPTLDDFEDFAAARALRAALRGKRKVLDDQIKVIRQQMYKESETDGDDAMTIEAKHLLNGGGAESVESISATDLRDQLREAEHRREVVQQAMYLQKGTYDEIQGRRSTEIAEHFVDQHEQAIGRIARAVVELAEANRQERQVHRDLAAAGVPGSHIIPNYGFPGVGDPHDMNSRAYHWLKRMSDLGFDLGDGI